MNEVIVQLKNILDDLNEVSFSSNADSMKKAMELCEISEHIQHARFHLKAAINRMIVYQQFEKK